MHDQWELRIIGILGRVTVDEEDGAEDDCPTVSYETLKKYRDYLKRNLVFPFEAVYDQETGPINSVTRKVIIASLDEEVDEFYGLFCQGKEGRCNVTVPLAELTVSEADPNYHFIDDYLTWFWNYR